MRFPTKKDLWLVALVSAVVVVLVYKGIDELGGPHRPAGWMLLGIAAFLSLVFYSFAVYELTGGELVIRSQLWGVRFGAIPLTAIVEVRPTRNPLSAPAWSLDRLQIDYVVDGRKRLGLISPGDREGFYRALLQAAPHLERKGERLVARPRG